MTARVSLSGLTGENMVQRTNQKLQSWYTGQTLLEMVDDVSRRSRGVLSGSQRPHSSPRLSGQWISPSVSVCPMCSAPWSWAPLSLARCGVC